MALARIICGDALRSLSKIESNSAHTCVTSPPYYGLRCYGEPKWSGGDKACDHTSPSGGSGENTAKPGRTHTQRPLYLGSCGKCGAIRVDEQIGLEQTPDEYVAKLVAVFREVRRVLRDDGTLWLNLGDSYARNGGEPGGGNRTAMHLEGVQRRMLSIPDGSGLKPKDLIGIPWRVAFALQADGWYLRQDIIWHKPNAMPESVVDRCTKAHEYIFLLSKSGRYRFDGQSIRQFTTQPLGIPRLTGQHKVSAEGFHRNGTRGSTLGSNQGHETKNRRSVWSVNLRPSGTKHLAAYPVALIEPCILAGCPVGGTVLDPFLGSGTTAVAAIKHGRECIGVELVKEYAEMAKSRIMESINGAR